MTGRGEHGENTARRNGMRPVVERQSHRAPSGRTARDDRAVHLETGEEYPDGGDGVPRGRQRPEPARTELAAHGGRHGQRPERRAPREERDASWAACASHGYTCGVAAPVLAIGPCVAVCGTYRTRRPPLSMPSM